MSNRNNDIIKRAIQRIALQGKVNHSTGVWNDSVRVTGYVSKIHDQEDDKLCGTIDVQEFDTQSFVQEENGVSLGLHEGVYLSALQNNKEGYLIVPKLYSEVTIAMDPQSRTEYVVMFSHVDLIQLDSHEQISVGVREREPFDENEDGDDIDELKLTGIKTNTTYTKDSISTTVICDKDAEKTVSQVMDKSGLTQAVDKDKSKFTMTDSEIIAEHDRSILTLDDSQSRIEHGSSSVTVEDGTVYVGNKTGVDDAVLGQQLASLLSELVGYLGQMMTPTSMGPQPPSNVMGQFISLQSRIQSLAASHSGFLTQRVQIQK